MLSVGKSVLCPDCAFILTLKFPYKTLSSVEVRDTLPAVDTHGPKGPAGALLEPLFAIASHFRPDLRARASARCQCSVANRSMLPPCGRQPCAHTHTFQRQQVTWHGGVL